MNEKSIATTLNDIDNPNGEMCHYKGEQLYHDINNPNGEMCPQKYIIRTVKSL